MVLNEIVLRLAQSFEPARSADCILRNPGTQ
jgi:hypothetical protein